MSTLTTESAIRAAITTALADYYIYSVEDPAGEAAMAKAAAAVLSVLAPSGLADEGEAVERVRAWVVALETPNADGVLPQMSYAAMDVYGNNIGFRSAAIADLRSLLAAVEGLAAELDAARDLAFRAAFAPEQGSEVQWGVQFPGDSTVSGVSSEGAARNVAREMPEAVRRRVVGPWKPVSGG